MLRMNSKTMWQKIKESIVLNESTESLTQIILKMATKEKGGKGVGQRVQDSSITPTIWHEFLRLDQNKRELFCYLQIFLTNHD